MPVILLAIFKDNLEPVWRLSLGLGIIPPLSVLYCKYFLFKGKKKREIYFNAKTKNIFPSFFLSRFFFSKYDLFVIITKT